MGISPKAWSMELRAERKILFALAFAVSPRSTLLASSWNFKP
jgi:hypothetical protein